MSAPPERQDRALRLVPKVVAGRYEPVARIASGGMATVYLAKSTVGAGFEKLVALKCVHPHMTERSDFVAMFLDEARIAARIDHPNVCHVFDAGEDDGTYFIAMEYLHGESLAQVMRAWSDSPPEHHLAIACRMLADAALGLHAAHALRGPDGEPLALVHRDVSPQNLFVTYDGSVKVVDFGIAKAHGRLHQTTTGVVRGKVAYMSPEQARSEPLDRRADVWALGVTLWELLTLRRLFRRDDQFGTLRALLEEPIDPPSRHAPEVTPELDRIVMAALTRDPARRTPDARTFADALNQHLAARGTHIGMSELSDCMRATFSDAIAEKESFKRMAETTPSALRLRAPNPPSEPVAEVSASIELPLRGRPRLGWLAAGLATVLGLGGGIAAVLVASKTEPAPDAGASTTHEVPAAPPTDVPPPPVRAEPGPAETTVVHREAPARTVRSRTRARRPTTEPASTAAPVQPPAVERPPVERPPVEPPAVEPPAVGPPAAEPPAVEPPAAEPASGQAVRPAPPAPPRPVRIVHPTGGWATVRVDGRARGNTPITLPAVRPGSHLIELRPYGSGPPIQHRVLIPPGAGAHVLRFPVPPPP